MNRNNNRDIDEPSTSPVDEAHCAVKLTLTAVATVDTCEGYDTVMLTGDNTPGGTALTRGKIVICSESWLVSTPAKYENPHVADLAAKFARKTGTDTPELLSGETSTDTYDGTNIKSAT